MLITLLTWAYVTLVTYGAGRALLRLGTLLLGDAPPLPWPFICLLGIAGLTTGLGYVWLAWPIQWELSVAVLVLSLMFITPTPGWWGRAVRLVTLRSLPILLVFLLILLRTVQPVRVIDTGGYHAPMIEWVRQYALVPGLANLNYRFGFNNAWFLPNAFFAFPLPNGSVWHGLNGWMLLMMGCLALTSASQLLVALVGGMLLVFHWTLSSPSPDLPTQLYVGLCFWLWLLPNRTPTVNWLLLLLALAAMTTKLSAVTVLVLPALTILTALKQRHWRFVSLAIGTIVVCTGYWWVSNVVLTGYLFYPSLSPLANWFTVDWKVPNPVLNQAVYNLAQGTKAGYVGNPLLVWQWVPHWFLTRPLLEQVTVAGLGMGMLVNVPNLKGQAGVLQITTWLGVLFWFLLAPHLRFGAAAVCMALILSYGSVLQKLPTCLGQIGLIVAPYLVLIPLLVAALQRGGINWLLPAAYPKTALHTYQIGNLTVYYPTDDPRTFHQIRGYWGDCYDAPLPCSPYPNPVLQPRGTTLPTGFRLTNSIPHSLTD